jgi:hypothetical protein
MIKAGGILAIIAGLLGVLAGVVTLLMGGLGAAFSTGGASTVVSMGWGGILFSLLVVVYGAIAFAAPRAGGIGLALTAIPGMVLGGTLVAVLMVVALIAALMIWLGNKKAQSTESTVTTGRWRGMAAAAVAPVLCTVLIGGQVFGSKDSESANVGSTPADQIVQVGQTVRSGQFEVTVRSLRFAETLGRGISEQKATPGTIFAVLDVLVRCVDIESRYYSAGDLLVELDGKTLKFDRSEVVLGLDSPIGNINPMTDKAGYVVYKIPLAAANAPLSWTPGRSFEKTRFSLNAPTSPAVAPVAEAATQATMPATPASTNTADANTAQRRLVGTYVEADGNTLQIQEKANGTLGFSLFAISPTGNTGEAEGLLTLAGNAYSYRNADLDCLLTFQPTGNTLVVAQEGMCGFGMNVFGAGIYRKQAER